MRAAVAGNLGGWPPPRKPAAAGALGGKPPPRRLADDYSPERKPPMRDLGAAAADAKVARKEAERPAALVSVLQQAGYDDRSPHEALTTTYAPASLSVAEELWRAQAAIAADERRVQSAE